MKACSNRPCDREFDGDGKFCGPCARATMIGRRYAIAEASRPFDFRESAIAQDRVDRFRAAIAGLVVMLEWTLVRERTIAATWKVQPSGSHRTRQMLALAWANLQADPILYRAWRGSVLYLMQSRPDYRQMIVRERRARPERRGAMRRPFDYPSAVDRIADAARDDARIARIAEIEGIA